MARSVPRRCVAHLTDAHLRPASAPLLGGLVDPAAVLRRAVGVLERWDHPCDAWFFGGDLSDTGDAETYAALRAIVEPAASARGVRVIYANGNHDDPDAFARVLWGEPAAGPLHREHRLGGLRWLCLDSTVPGAPHGEVSEAAADWLAGRLASPAPEGTVLALHHPPLPVVQDAAARWDLRGAERLAAAVAGSDVRLIVGGHFHQTMFSTLGGVPVAASTSLVAANDLTAGRTLRPHALHGGFNLIQLYDDRVVVSAVPLDAGPGVLPALPPGGSGA